MMEKIVEETRLFLQKIRKNFLESVDVETVGRNLLIEDIITSEQLERVRKQGSTLAEQRLQLYLCLYDCPQANSIESIKKVLVKAKQSFIINACDNSVTEKSGSTNSSNESKIIQKLKYHYESCYCFVNVLAWDQNKANKITDLWINLSLKSPKESFFGRKVGDENCPYENLVAQILGKTQRDDFEPQLILVTGSAGIGKTTLIKRLAYDWSREKENEKLIVTVPLRNMNGIYKTLNEMVLESLQDRFEKEDASDVQKTINKALDLQNIKTDGLIVMLDGWDEFSGQCDNLDKILERKLIMRYSLLITCRQRDRRIIRCDKQIELPGFTTDQVTEYVDKIVFKEKPQYSDAMRKFLEENPKMQQVARVPLLLNHLCAVCDFHDGQIPETAKKLFDDIIDCFLFKYAEANKINENPKKIFSTLHYTAVGKLAFTGLLETRYQWLDSETSSTDELKKAIEIGFLTTSKVPVLYSKENTVSFIHPTFQEYFAAFYAKEHNETEKVANFLKKIVENDETAKQYELFQNFFQESREMN